MEPDVPPQPMPSADRSIAPAGPRRPSMERFIQDARESGLTDFDISKFILAEPSIRPFFDQAREAGHKDEEIFKFLGLRPENPKRTKWDDSDALSTGVLSLPLLDVGPRVKAAGLTLSGNVSPGVRETFGLREPAQEKYSELPITGYDQALREVRQSRQDYEKESPIKSPALEIAGSLPTSMGVGAVLNAGIRRTLSPGAARFMTGEAGYDAAGFPTNVGPMGASTGPLTRIGSQATQGGLQGGTAGLMTSGNDPKESETPLIDRLDRDMLTGMVTGGTVGPLVNKAANWARGAPISTERAALADEARRLGIPLRTSQVGNSPIEAAVDTAREAIPGSGLARQVDREVAGFNSALTRTIGENADGLTRETMGRARARIGSEFDRVAQGTNIFMDTPMLRELADIRLRARTSMIDPNAADRIGSLIQHIQDRGHANNRYIDGAMYQELTKHNSTLDRLMNSGNADVEHYAREVRQLLDRQLQNYAPPGMQDALRTARMQWKNLKVLEKFAAESGPEGIIEPRQMKSLLTKVIKAHPGFAYADQGELGTLAEIGHNFIRQARPDITGHKILAGTIAGADVLANSLVQPHNMAGLAHGDPMAILGTVAGMGAPLLALRAAGARYSNPARMQRLIDMTQQPTAPGMRVLPRAASGAAGEVSEQQR